MLLAMYSKCRYQNPGHNHSSKIGNIERQRFLRRIAKHSKACTHLPIKWFTRPNLDPHSCLTRPWKAYTNDFVHIHSIVHQNLIKIRWFSGRGTGISGRAMAFCLRGAGSNPWMDLGLFWITYNRTRHTLPSSFLFSIIIYLPLLNLSIVIK